MNYELNRVNAIKSKLGNWIEHTWNPVDTYDNKHSDMLYAVSSLFTHSATGGETKEISDLHYTHVRVGGLPASIKGFIEDHPEYSVGVSYTELDCMLCDVGVRYLRSYNPELFRELRIWVEKRITRKMYKTANGGMDYLHDVRGLYGKKPKGLFE